MAENILRPVRDLLNEHFYVPKYQRGYRWKKKQVEDLLNDIDKFEPSNDEGKNSWYCLQPLVIKKDFEKKFRLIDGQQRLTTIKLILHYLNTRFPDDERIDIFSINYETREKYGDWLDVVENKDMAEKNIDFLHIYDSYQNIKSWMIEQKQRSDFKISNFREKLLHTCKFIWYDIDQNGQNIDKEEDVFIRLNDGKIPLTNSELIKALFLNSSNFAKDKNEEEIRLKQLEISTQWDIIEQELSDNEFWYFINGKENQVNPRIEYLFDIIANKPEDNIDKDFTFRKFQSDFEKNEQVEGDKKDFVNKKWENILNTYLIFKEWYNDKDRCYYHPIGYLLCRKHLHNDKELQSAGELLHEYQNTNKDTFKFNLKERIKQSLSWNGDEITFQDKQRVSKILLLHNAVTTQNQKNEMARFSFQHYIGTKKEKGWDIEHIHARAEKPPKKIEHRKDWLNEKIDDIKDKNLKYKVEQFSNYANDDIYNQLFEEINQYFENESELNDDNLDNLSNLALLDANTNRGYGNDYYSDKRKEILKKDQLGTFIPMCTKKIFLKYYTEKPPNMTFWGKDDREAYLKDIREKLSDYLTK